MAFVPEGQADSSQARSAWYRRKAAPSRRDGRSHCQSQCQQNRFNRPARRGHFPRDSRHFRAWLLSCCPIRDKTNRIGPRIILELHGSILGWILLSPRDEEPSQTVLIFVPFNPAGSLEISRNR